MYLQIHIDRSAFDWCQCPRLRSTSSERPLANQPTLSGANHDIMSYHIMCISNHIMISYHIILCHVRKYLEQNFMTNSGECFIISKFVEIQIRTRNCQRNPHHLTVGIQKVHPQPSLEIHIAQSNL